MSPKGPRHSPGLAVAAAATASTAACPLFLLLCLAASLAAEIGPSSLQRETFCSLNEVHLRCESNRYLLAIHSAHFTTDSESLLNGTCQKSVEDVLPLEVCSEDVRLSLNSRCAGSSECVYNYSHDHYLDKTCGTLDGAIVVEYNCVQESSILRYCNFPSSSLEGYVSSPGYPSFFPHLVNCTWTILAGDGQTISMALLDYHLRAPRFYYGRYVCDEAVSIHDGPNASGTKLVSACGQSLQGLKSFETTGNKALVIFNSDKFTPFRGFLLYYKAQGCPTLPAPKDGYMVYRNGTSALYMCCKGHLFNDTLDNTRSLHCVDGQHWNSTLPAACLSFEELRESGNYSDVDLIWNNTRDSSRPSVHRADSNMLADIIIPSALMASLIVGNIVVMIIILKIRRKSKDNDDFDEDEQPKPSSSAEPPNTDV